MGNGFTSQQIARELNVSTQTIRNWTERYPIEVEVEEDTSKRIYNERAFKQLIKINYLKDHVDELIRKELMAATPSYQKLQEEKKQLLEEVRKWKRAQENLLMNNEILLGKKRELELELRKKSTILSRLIEERDKRMDKMKELTEYCEKMHKKVTDYELLWGNEQRKGLYQILWERIVLFTTRLFYTVKSQEKNKDF